ncbi:MAG: Asp-tRNA(Asn)/Glu-tRNA(Gln) amidotransferase subunit GatC [Phycisphaerales bacterium]|nr:Asp-tRNA(Asn)/Glu-tRNA(Gln) amidotransferase subunit GatC [Phycisphaerales bacterium]
MTERELSVQDVRHIAKLSRLAPDDATVEAMRSTLSSILGHIAKLSTIDVAGAEPMAHPLSITNRLDADVPGPTLSIDLVLLNAPAKVDRFLAVPKVLDEGGA